MEKLSDLQDKNPAFSILVVEDNPVVLHELGKYREKHKELNLVIANTKGDATRIITTKTDFDIVFISWHLLGVLTTDLIKLTARVQRRVIDIVVTSSGEYIENEIEPLKVGATRECNKNKIPEEIMRIGNKVEQHKFIPYPV